MCTAQPKAVIHLSKSLEQDSAAAMCGVFHLPLKAVTPKRSKVTCELCANIAKELMSGKTLPRLCDRKR